MCHRASSMSGKGEEPAEDAGKEWPWTKDKSGRYPDKSIG